MPAGLYGSEMLNQEFHEFLSHYLKPDFHSILIALHKLETPENTEYILNAGVKCFERHKKHIGDREECDLRIGIPGVKQTFKTSRRMLGSSGKLIPRFFFGLLLTDIANFKQGIRRRRLREGRRRNNRYGRAADQIIQSEIWTSIIGKT